MHIYIQMKKSSDRQSQDNSAHSQNISKLMSSIEQKLSILARDEFQPSLAQETFQPPQTTPHKKSHLQIEDLARSEQPSSPILSRFSHIEEHYLSKLTVLNQRVTILESQNAQLLQKNQQLQTEVLQQKERVVLLQQQQQRMLEARIEEMKENLFSRMRSEFQQQTQNYLLQLDQMREQLVQERKLKKQLQGKVELVNIERDHFEEMYREMMEKYRNIMQADLHLTTTKTKRIPDHQQPRGYGQDPELIQTGTKTKKRKSRRSKDERQVSETLPKEELIPFLAKGISELKEKLSFK